MIINVWSTDLIDTLFDIYEYLTIGMQKYSFILGRKIIKLVSINAIKKIMYRYVTTVDTTADWCSKCD